MSPVLIVTLGSGWNPRNRLSLSWFRMNDVDVSCWIAMSPASAPSIEVLAA